MLVLALPHTLIPSFELVPRLPLQSDNAHHGGWLTDSQLDPDPDPKPILESACVSLFIKPTEGIDCTTCGRKGGCMMIVSNTLSMDP